MKLDWYKQSKIIDLDMNPARVAPVICPICHKWKTEDNEGNIIWKYYYTMDPEEQAEVDEIKQMSDTGNSTPQMRHCPDCDVS